MAERALIVALITEIFDSCASRALADRLADAAVAGAELAVLPELPMDPWIPARSEPAESDAEAAGGRRQQAMAAAARDAGVAMVGGAIVRDSGCGRRYNTAFLWTADGVVAGAYRKVHVPFEPGNWESAHYESGETPPAVIRDLALPTGLQICSDANRPSLLQALAAAGAEVIVVPRATPADSWPRWRLVLRAAAVTTAAWVVSVNRPAAAYPEGAAAPSVVIAPDGEVVLETTEGLAFATLDGGAVEAARRTYPGELPFPWRVYRKAWATADPSSAASPSDDGVHGSE